MDSSSAARAVGAKGRRLEKRTASRKLNWRMDAMAASTGKYPVQTGH